MIGQDFWPNEIICAKDSQVKMLDYVVVRQHMKQAPLHFALNGNKPFVSQVYNKL